MDANIKCQKARMKEGIMPIKSLQARWRRETFQTQYPMWNFPWLPWKSKIISAMKVSVKCKKSRTEEGIIPIKSLRVGWWREKIQTQHPIWNCSWLPWKWKMISAMDSNIKWKKAGMEEDIMLLKSLWAGWRRENII